MFEEEGLFSELLNSLLNSIKIFIVHNKCNKNLCTNNCFISNNIRAGAPQRFLARSLVMYDGVCTAEKSKRKESRLICEGHNANVKEKSLSCNTDPFDEPKS